MNKIKNMYIMCKDYIYASIFNIYLSKNNQILFNYNLYKVVYFYENYLGKCSVFYQSCCKYCNTIEFCNFLWTYCLSTCLLKKFKIKNVGD